MSTVIKIGTVPIKGVCLGATQLFRGLYILRDSTGAVWQTPDGKVYVYAAESL